MMFVENYINKLWYQTKVVILDNKDFDRIRTNPNIDLFRSNAIFYGLAYELKDNAILSRYVKSVGIISDTLTIIV